MVIENQILSSLEKNLDGDEIFRQREEKGKLLYRIAWAVEFLAVAIGLAIAWAMSYAAFKEVPDPNFDTYIKSLTGALPFVVIAVIELTKIPLAMGFYMAKGKWQYLFLFAMLTLIFVTFETMFTGLEINLSNVTRSIVNQENVINETNDQIKTKNDEILSKEKIINELKNQDTFTISNITNEEINRTLKERDLELEALNEQLNSELKPYEEERDQYRKEATEQRDPNITQSQLNNIDSQVASNEKKINNNIAAKEKEIANLETIYKTQLESFKDRRNNINNSINNIRENITRLTEDKSFLKQNKSEIEQYNQDKKNQENLLNNIDAEERRFTEGHQQKINQVVAKYERVIESLQRDNNELFNKKKETSEVIEKSIAIKGGEIAKKIEITQQKINSINKKYADLKSNVMEKYSLQANQIKEKTNVETTRITKSKEDIPILENERKLLLKEIEELKELQNEAAKIKRDKVQGSSVYRLAALWYGKDDPAEVKKEEVKTISIIWFGSIAFIIATIGVILALASFVLRDKLAFIKNEERYVFKSISRLITRLSHLVKRLAMIIKYIGQGIYNVFGGVASIFGKSVRNSIRRFFIELRKRARQPKIQIVEKEVPVEVEKVKEVIVEKEIPVEKIKEVIVEKEKVVYQEVPKEVVRKELVHVPLYSTEDGKVNLDGRILTEVATKNFTEPNIIKESTSESKAKENKIKKEKKPSKNKTKNKDANFEDTDK